VFPGPWRWKKHVPSWDPVAWDAEIAPIPGGRAPDHVSVNATGDTFPPPLRLRNPAFQGPGGNAFHGRPRAMYPPIPGHRAADHVSVNATGDTFPPPLRLRNPAFQGPGGNAFHGRPRAMYSLDRCDAFNLARVLPAGPCFGTETSRMDLHGGHGAYKVGPHMLSGAVTPSTARPLRSTCRVQRTRKRRAAVSSASSLITRCRL